MARERMPTNRRPMDRTRRNGLIAAALLTVVLGAVFVGAALTGSGTPSARGVTPDEDEFANIEAVQIGQNEAGAGEEMLLQLADEDDATRLAGEITADAFQPIDAQTRRVENPAAWLFLEDDRTIRITSETGRLVVPKNSNRPRSGVLEGDVLLRLYEVDPALADEQGRPDLDRVEPVLVATFSEPVAFDLDLAQLSTPGRVVVTTAELEFIASDLFTVLNETEERIEFLEFQRGEKITFYGGSPSDEPAPAPRQQRQPRTPREPSTQTTAQAETQPAPTAELITEPKIDLYEITALGDITLTQGELNLDADTMDAWLRLVDNSLPPTGASGTNKETQPRAGQSAPRSAPQRTAAAQPTNSARETTAAAATPAQPTPADDPIVFTWTGKLTLEPLSEPNEQLEADDLAVRFTATESDAVTIADAGSGATGRATTIDYAMTRELITLADDAGAVELASADAGRLEGANRIDIALRDGLVNVRSGGTLIDARNADDDSPRGLLAWQDHADFTFATDDGRMTDALKRAVLVGHVSGRSDDATLTGSRFDADFITNADGNPEITRVDVWDAVASQADGGSLTASALRVLFDQDANRNDPEPVRLLAMGDVDAKQADGGYLRAQTLDADLSRDEDDQLQLSTVFTEGRVQFDDAAGTTGTARTMLADVTAETATLTGPDARAAREGSTIASRRLDVDGRAGTLAAHGNGNFARGLEATETTPAGLVTATWTESMTYDEPTGILTADGNVVATSERFGAERDRFNADRLVAVINRGESDSLTSDLGSGTEDLQSARLFGTTDALANVEARRYFERTEDDPPAFAPRLAELVFLESTEIDYQADGQRITTPAPGRLLVVDRRSAEEDAAAGKAPAELNPGQTLFTWQGDMSLAYDAGEAHFEDDVVVTHLDLRTNRPAIAEAETIDATFDPAPDEEETEAETEANTDINSGGTLKTLLATGGVVFRSDTREILADRVRYNADAGTALATAEAGRIVTYFDASTGTVTRALELRWDLLTDRIDIIKPAPTVAPQPSRER
ncbi:MAG: hypothetical protein AAGI17_11100 [Planctomycetota bacterium]